MPAVRIIGPGRAGRALAAALGSAGWPVTGLLGRGDDVVDAAAAVDLLVIATPDSAIADVARQVEPSGRCVVAHVSGSLGLDVLAPHPRRGSLHPLRSISAPSASLSGAWFAVAGDPLVRAAVAAVGGRALDVGDEHRAAYHAAATVAANHLVALLAQVERIAAGAGVPLAAYLDLARSAVGNVERSGVAAALTGPVARGDWATVVRHLDALPADEALAYVAMAEAAARVAGRRLPREISARAEVPVPVVTEAGT